jgi:hypothetical protein
MQDGRGSAEKKIVRLRDRQRSKDTLNEESARELFVGPMVKFLIEQGFKAEDIAEMFRVYCEERSRMLDR